LKSPVCLLLLLLLHSIGLNLFQCTSRSASRTAAASAWFGHDSRFWHDALSAHRQNHSELRPMHSRNIQLTV
jgi:hypothetical protein